MLRFTRKLSPDTHWLRFRIPFGSSRAAAAPRDTPSNGPILPRVPNRSRSGGPASLLRLHVLQRLSRSIGHRLPRLLRPLPRAERTGDARVGHPGAHRDIDRRNVDSDSIPTQRRETFVGCPAWRVPVAVVVRPRSGFSLGNATADASSKSGSGAGRCGRRPYTSSDRDGLELGRGFGRPVRRGRFRGRRRRRAYRPGQPPWAVVGSAMISIDLGYSRAISMAWRAHLGRLPGLLGGSCLEPLELRLGLVHLALGGRLVAADQANRRVGFRLAAERAGVVVDRVDLGQVLGLEPLEADDPFVDHAGLVGREVAVAGALRAGGQVERRSAPGGARGPRRGRRAPGRACPRRADGAGRSRRARRSAP